MKSNKIMVRKMGSFNVLQRTSDGYFDANALLQMWNKDKGEGKRQMSKYLQLEKTIAFINEIELVQLTDNQVIDKTIQPGNQAVMQQRGRTEKRGKRTADKVWMHPYLFIDFAMWINPRFKLKVMKFVYDQLIQFRHDAGDHYKVLSQAAARFYDVDYSKMAKGLNYIVFGCHDKDLRQRATPEQLRELADLQKTLAFAVNMGYINSFDTLLTEIERIQKNKLHKQLSA
jgi:hypothetical protein